MIKLDKTYLIALVPVALFAAYWQARPCQAVLGEAHSRISHLSRASKANIGLACKKIDGSIIPPGGTFSFNHTVGPRELERGFVLAPTYLDNSTSNTAGGGVCLVSSLVYESALESGMSVSERKPHSRTISTVLPGLDATVWYGTYDLKFKNTTKEPVQIKCKADFYNASIEFLGPKNVETVKVVRQEKAAPDSLAVTVFLQKGDKLETISQDMYELRSKRN